ncbi:MAG TPA: hypothetical protein VFM29_06910, partial [Vicinamibacteria bacterium]|nr:hypothetical protein [Vicinamibacteria bacterium]
MTLVESFWSQAHLAPAFKIVIAFVLGLGVLTALACVTLLVHHGYTSAHRRHRGDLVRRATSFLGPYVESGDALGRAAVECR